MPGAPGSGKLEPMEHDDAALATARVRLRAAGYDLVEARRLADGTIRVEAWPHGVEFHATARTGVGRTIREAVEDLIGSGPPPP